MAAKVAKCCPWLYTDANTTVWMDGGARLQHPGAVEWAVAHGQYAQWLHPERTDVTDEAKVSAELNKYRDQPVVEQAAWYHTDGLPDDWGLWACGFMVRPRWWPLAEPWLVEQMRWSWQDQLSLPWLLWKLGIRPTPLEGSLWNNPHVRFTGHASDA